MIRSDHVPGEVLVRLKPGLTADFLQQAGARVVDRFEVPAEMNLPGDIVQIRLPEGESAEQAVERLRKDSRVATAAPNHVYKLASCPPPPPPPPPALPSPNDLDERLWGLRNVANPEADIDAQQAWRVSTGVRENGPIVAVLDTGVDFAHPDLANNLWTNPGEIPDNGIDDDGNGVVDDVHGYDATQDAGGGE
ncbi:MAG: hypothetical protein AB1758_26845, partial [Candidatus Eremiobacterota bacterium]